MSLINDALKQAKRDNSGQTSDSESSDFSGQTPEGTAPVATSSGGGYRVLKLIAIILIAVAVIAISALNAYYLFSGGNNEQKNTAAEESDNEEKKEPAEAKTPIETAEKTAEKITERGREDLDVGKESQSSKEETANEDESSDEENESGSQNARDELLNKITITGVLSSGGNSMAVINGTVVKTGESISGVTLEKIGAKNVFIRYNDKVYPIPKP